MSLSLIPANIEYLGFAYQSAKGSAASAPTICVNLQDCGLEPGRETDRVNESDRSSQQGDLAVTAVRPGGTFKKYLRPSEDDFFLYGLLGKTVDAGTTPKTHVLTIDDAAPFVTPWLTVFNVWPGVATIKYTDVRIGQAVITCQPGGMVEVEYTLVALGVALGATEPSSVDALFTNELPHTWPELTATLAGAHGGDVNQLSLTIDRNTGRFDGDNGFYSGDAPNEKIAVSGNLEVAFQDDDRLRAASTGTVGGTVPTTTIYNESMVFDFLRSSLLETKFTIANAEITNYKTALKTDASPALATFDFTSKRQTTLANIVQVDSKNAKTKADRSS